MAIETLSSGASSTGSESFSFVVDYDTVAETIGLTCTGTGHSTLTVVETSNQTSLGGLNGDQYGTTSGPLTNGKSASAVTYSGSRVIVLGPGATGVDTTGATLLTSVIPSAVVGAFNVPKGQTPGLAIGLGWTPNSFGHAVAKATEPSLAEAAKHCLHSKTC